MGILSKFSVAAANFDVEVKKFFRSMFEVATIAAAGSDQTDATALTAGKNLVTASDGTKGVILPRSEPEMAVTVVNTVAASDLKVYPDASGQINALTATTGAFTIPGGQEATFHCDAGLHWYVSTGSGASAAELEVLNGASAANTATGKAAILGTSGAITFGGAVTAVGSFIIGSADMSEADLEQLDGITAGTAAASKALVLDASKELAWAMTDAGTGTVTPLDFALTATGPGASVDGAKFATATEAALGTYANGLNAKLDFGTNGYVTGLGGAFCAELDLGPGTASGSYAVFEAELNAPASASLGTRTSFMSMNAWGANVAAVDTGAFLFDLNGLTASSGKLFNSGLSQVVTAAARLRCQVGGTSYYIPLCAAEALTS